MAEKIKVGLSVLEMRPLNLQQAIAQSIENEIDYLHLDITDRRYVSNLGLDLETIKKACSEKRIKTRIHFMVFEPRNYLKNFNSDLPETVYFHFHSTRYLLDFVRSAEELELKKGLVILPGNDFREMYGALKYFDEVLFMGVNPGGEDQEFLDEVYFNIQDFVLNRPLEKNLELRKIVIGVEGGVDEKNCGILRRIGVTNFIVGNSYYNSKDKKEFVREIKNL
jgi:ribulose-phosphate 3-epimerase